MRINKMINGEIYTFYLQFIPNKMKAKIRFFHGKEWIICDISKDFKHIIIPDGKICFENKCIKTIKLSKERMFDAIDYNSL